MLTGIRAVLLDMDGTLVDSDAAVERAWRSWSAEYGGDPVLRTSYFVPSGLGARPLRR